MKTFMANESNIERKWYVVDASGMALGRLASQVASILKGKNKPTYTPHVDTGDFVIVINTDKIMMTGKKLDKKFHRYHTFHPGGLKEISYRKFIAEKSDRVIYEAVKAMLPNNSLGRTQLKKLRVYKGAEHEHQAQKPAKLDLVVKSYQKV